MKHIHFLQHFSPGEFEFCISNSFGLDYKILSNTFFRNHFGNQIRTAKILEYISEYTSKMEDIRSIFNYFNEHSFHIGIDTLNFRVKFYISLYEYPFDIAIKKIFSVKEFLNIEEKYFLEKDFIKFDCLGFDIDKDGNISMKIYEITSGKNIVIPFFIKYESIKEYGVLKDFYGRVKTFIRFKEALDISIFSEHFCLEDIYTLQKEIGDLYKLQKKVKYYCYESSKKEIYFI